ncbi:MAG: hypothetical protein H7833_12015 [Magnetococcus sp. DMHC-1]
MFHFIFGLVAYAAFNVVFMYFAGFLANFHVPKSIDAPLTGSDLPLALTINLVLLTVFALHHSITPRHFFKKWLLRHLPAHLERSVYVLLASVLLALVMWQWQPMPQMLWQVENIWGKTILLALYLVGVVAPLVASFHIDHYDLFGLRQVQCYLLNRPYVSPPFDEKGLYRLVRHPIMLGTLIVLWATPAMTMGHFLLALFLTGYIFVGIFFEERDLLRTIGKPYDSYRKRVPMLFPFLKRP